MPARAFKFRFAALLRYRKRVFDRLALELADLHRCVIEREAEILELERRHSSCTTDLEKRMAGKIDPEQIIMYHNYMEILSGRIHVVREEVARLNGQVHDKTKEVIAASKNRKIVERIRERDMVAFNKVVADTERKILDEVGANRASAMRGSISTRTVRQIQVN